MIKYIDESRPKLSEYIIKNIYKLLKTTEIYKNVPTTKKQKRPEKSYLFYTKIDRGYCIIVCIKEANCRNEIVTIMTYNKNAIKKLEPFKVPVLHFCQSGTTTLENKSPFRPSGPDKSGSMLS